MRFGPIAVALVALLNAGVGNSQDRTWTNSAGKQLTASLRHADESTAVLRLQNGANAPIPLASLSEADREFVKQALENRAVLPSFPPAVQAEGGASNFAVQAVSEPGAEFQRQLERTLAAVRALPLGLNPRPGPDREKFPVQVVDAAGYRAMMQANGVDPNLKPTAAFLREKLTLYVDHSVFREGTEPAKEAELQQEIAALTLLRWKMVLPEWFADGLAAAVASLPASGDVVQFSDPKTGLQQFLQTRYGLKIQSEPVPMRHPSDLFGASEPLWSFSAYDRASALMWAYFFLHLDDAGTPPGVPLARYLHSLEKTRSETEDFLRDYKAANADFEKKRQAFNAKIAQYNEELAVFRKNLEAHNQNVTLYNEQLKKGVPPEKRVKVGEAPKPPEKPEMLVRPKFLEQNEDQATSGPIDVVAVALKEATPLLLGGRDADTLAKQAVEAFAEIGIRVDLMKPGEQRGSYYRLGEQLQDALQ
ncbi:MAG: hypothetical protein HKN23_04685 [Verrucomicrobiales bacterium]|nr:hypothetical protein [Verrucomicrobiales bacterium]